MADTLVDRNYPAPSINFVYPKAKRKGLRRDQGQAYHGGRSGEGTDQSLQFRDQEQISRRINREGKQALATPTSKRTPAKKAALSTFKAHSKFYGKDYEKFVKTNTRPRTYVK